MSTWRRGKVSTLAVSGEHRGWPMLVQEIGGQPCFGAEQSHMFRALRGGIALPRPNAIGRTLSSGDPLSTGVRGSNMARILLDDRGALLGPPLMELPRGGCEL